MPGQQALRADVVLEGERFDEFLQPRGDLALVARGVGGLEVGQEGVEEGVIGILEVRGWVVRAYRWREKILIGCKCARWVCFGRGRAHIFLLWAVMSLEALTIRSRRSWCSSSSVRKVSNIGM